MASPYPPIDDAMVADFRAFYPEFSDTTKYPDAMIKRALGVAFDEAGGCSWGSWEDPNLPYSFWKRGVYALAAFYLSLWAGQAAAGGGAVTPGFQTGKTVRDESVAFAAPSAVTNAAQGDYLFSLSPYGLEWLRLRNRAGMGARAV